jgi:hypothetical protein
MPMQRGRREQRIWNYRYYWLQKPGKKPISPITGFYTTDFNPAKMRETQDP